MKRLAMIGLLVMATLTMAEAEEYRPLHGKWYAKIVPEQRLAFTQGVIDTFVYDNPGTVCFPPGEDVVQVVIDSILAFEETFSAAEPGIPAHVMVTGHLMSKYGCG